MMSSTAMAPQTALPFPGPLKIGGLVIDPPLLLAPMAGLSAWPMRLLSRRHGATLCVSEMVSATAVARNLPQPDALYALRTHPADRPLALQLFGPNAAEMAAAAQSLAAVEADIIDLNMGCPVRKVVHGGSGCALMRDLPKATAIIRAVRAAIKVPLTVKFRLGWETGGCEGMELAKICAGEGVDAITVHARSRQQGFTGDANLAALAEIVAAVKIPVIGNGGIKGFADAERMLRETGCAGIMVARGARGNPWIFDELTAGPDSPSARPSPAERGAAVLQHLEWTMELFPPRKVALEMRKHLAWYSRGIPGAVDLRRELQTIREPEQVREMVARFFREGV